MSCLCSKGSCYNPAKRQVTLPTGNGFCTFPVGDQIDIKKDGSYYKVTLNRVEYLFPIAIPECKSNADLLQGYPASYFATYGQLVNEINLRQDGDEQLDSRLNILESAGPYVLTSDYSDINVLNKIKNVDGHTSGLDADTLDGIQGSKYARLDQDNIFEGFAVFESNITVDAVIGENPLVRLRDSSGVPTADFAKYPDGSVRLVDRTGDTIEGNLALDGANLRLNGRDVYHELNIIGPVSQVDGLPTGAIIENTTNANGYVVRFADGTQICSSTVLANISADTVWNFGKPFSSVPIVTMTGTGSSPRIPTRVGISNSQVTFNTWDLSGNRTNSNTFLIAIGRWF